MLILLERYKDSFSAKVVKSFLESEGIPSFIFGDVPRLKHDPVFQYIDIIVNDTDYERAKLLLKEKQNKEKNND
jgi:hypothetical protein